jgi:hypothetical protein
MSPLGLVELQGVSDAVDDAVRDAGGVAALQPGVVLARDACEESDLVAAQARDPPAVSAEHRKPGLLRRDLGPSRGQELPDLPADVATDVTVVSHAFTLRADWRRLGSLSVAPFSGSPTEPRGVVS